VNKTYNNINKTHDLLQHSETSNGLDGMTVRASCTDEGDIRINSNIT